MSNSSPWVFWSHSKPLISPEIRLIPTSLSLVVISPLYHASGSDVGTAQKILFLSTLDQTHFSGNVTALKGSACSRFPISRRYVFRVLPSAKEMSACLPSGDALAVRPFKFRAIFDIPPVVVFSKYAKPGANTDGRVVRVTRFFPVTSAFH